MDLYLPQSVRDAARTVPDWFKQRLNDTDRNLIVYFNPLRQRWIIDRCTREDMHDTHGSLCPKTNVMVLQGEDNEYLPLCDGAIDRIRSIDAWSAFGSYENYQRDRINRELAAAAKREVNIDDAYKHASRDNKRQLSQAYTLVQRHDVARVNQ